MPTTFKKQINMSTQTANLSRWQQDEDYFFSQYNQAYDYWVHCPNDKAHKAKKELDYWRNKWLNH